MKNLETLKMAQLQKNIFHIGFPFAKIIFISQLLIFSIALQFRSPIRLHVTNQNYKIID